MIVQTFIYSTEALSLVNVRLQFFLISLTCVLISVTPLCLVLISDNCDPCSQDTSLYVSTEHSKSSKWESIFPSFRSSRSDQTDRNSEWQREPRVSPLQQNNVLQSPPPLSKKYTFCYLTFPQLSLLTSDCYFYFF